MKRITDGYYSGLRDQLKKDKKDLFMDIAGSVLYSLNTSGTNIINAEIERANIKIMKKINIRPIQPVKLFLIVMSIPPIFKDENKKKRTANASVPIVITK